jgi:histone H3/H4
MADLPLAAVARIAKNNGAERVGADATEALVELAEGYLAKLVREANKLANHAGRKTLRQKTLRWQQRKSLKTFSPYFICTSILSQTLSCTDQTHRQVNHERLFDELSFVPQDKWERTKREYYNLDAGFTITL